MGHRLWLPKNHRFRFQSSTFDGTEEFREAPSQTSGSEILLMLEDMNFGYGKMNQPANTQRNRRSNVEADDNSDEEDDPNEADLWKRRSIFLSCFIGSTTFYDTILILCILRKISTRTLSVQF